MNIQVGTTTLSLIQADISAMLRCAPPQNTFTGRLTEPMLDRVFTTARTHLT